MKKLYLIGAVTLAVAGLSTGCSVHVSKDGNNLEINKSSEQSVKTSQSSSTKQKKTKKNTLKKAPTWDNHKAETLDQGMQSYAKQEKISFTKYDGEHTLKVSGGRIYPDTLKNDNFYLNNKKISIGWSPQGEHKYDYDVMSIYNHDLDDQGRHETYLFCMHDNKPIVLEDTTKDGKNINLIESTNKTINNNFNQVMAQD